MYLIAGLGNPEEQYGKTRHNAGFLAIDAFAQTHTFPSFEFDKYSNSCISKGEISQEKVLLAKPQTFMNNSGQAIKFLFDIHKIHNTTYIILMYDDIDLPLGKIRISSKGGSAGHKGVESVIRHLDTSEFIRIRIGIQPESGKPANTEKFVIQDFTPTEQRLVEHSIRHAAHALELVLTSKLQHAMNTYN